MRGLALLIAASVAHPASAFVADLKTTISDADLRKKLAGASLVFVAVNEKEQSTQDILAAAQADYARMVGALYALGYYSPVVHISVDGKEAAEIPPLAPPAQINRIDLIVDPGPIFSFGKAVVAPLAPDTVLPEGFAPGKTAESRVISDAASAGVDAWREYGHAKVAIDGQQITADHRNDILDAVVTLAPGPRVTFGRLVQKNDSYVRRERVQEIGGLPTGEVFKPEELDKAVARLRRTGAFRSVSATEAETLGPDNSMDVDLVLVDEKPRRFGFGADISSVEGLRLETFWMHRNLLGGAERLRVEAEASGLGGQTGGGQGSGIDYRFGVSFNRPATFTADTDLYALAEVKQLDEPLFFSRQINLETGLTRIYSDKLKAQVGVAYRFADVRDGLGNRQFNHLTFPVSVTWDRRGDKLNPKGGFYLDAEVMPYLGLAGSASGGRLSLDGRVYKGFGKDDRFVLAGRVQLGSIVGSGLTDTPPDLLFLSGGGGTVRGQPYQSLSVPVGTTKTGGRSFLGLSGEVRADITEKIGVVGFYDAGYIGADSFIDSNSYFHAGAGLGLRYNTGIGPIRFDVATPVGGNTGSGIQIYVGIGQAF